MTDNEKKLLVALVWMVQQHLDKHGDEVDSLSESAGEHAIEALADYGLMEVVNTRFGRWTESGKKFLAETSLRRSEEARGSGGIALVATAEPKK